MTVSNPSTRLARNRSFQRTIVGAVVCNCRWITVKDSPTANKKISLTRNTYPAGSEGD
jgi:hypothetical protein